VVASKEKLRKIENLIIPEKLKDILKYRIIENIIFGLFNIFRLFKALTFEHRTTE
jgi:hypothetical protein